MTDDLILALVRTIQIVGLALLPAMVWALGGRLIHALDTIHYTAVPGLARFSGLSGLVAGSLLLFVNHPPGAYDFDAVFDPAGPWAVGFLDLFTVWLDPRRYSPEPLWERVAPFDTGDPVAVLAAVSAGLAALATLGAIRFFGLRAFRALLANSLVWLWGAGVVVYAVCAVMWTLHVMNFWALVVGFFIYRHYHLKEH